MRTISYVALMVALAAPAHAQGLDVGRLMGAGSMKLKTQDEVDQEKQRNDDYKSTLKKLPDQNVKGDPWGSMRGAGAGQTGQKNTAQKQKQAAPKETSTNQAEQKQKQTGAQ